jgi:hypothetical protein
MTVFVALFRRTVSHIYTRWRPDCCGPGIIYTIIILLLSFYRHRERDRERKIKEYIILCIKLVPGESSVKKKNHTRRYLDFCGREMESEIPARRTDVYGHVV